MTPWKGGQGGVPRPSLRVFVVCLLTITCHLLPCGNCAADPVRPIDPAAWLSHTAALTGALPRYGTSPCSSAITRTSSSSLTSSVPGAPRKWQLTRAPQETEAEGQGSASALSFGAHRSYSRGLLYMKVLVCLQHLHKCVHKDTCTYLFKPGHSGHLHELKGPARPVLRIGRTW